MKKKFVVMVMLVWIIVFKLPISEWSPLTPQQKKEVLRVMGQNYCLAQDCSEAKITALEDNESVYFDAVCTRKEIKGLLKI